MSQWNKAEILKTSNGYWRACTLQVGVRLDIFTILGKKSLSYQEVAEQTGADFRGMEYLLNGLTGLGLLHKENGRYTNSDAAFRFLSVDSDENIKQIILHHKNILYNWAELDTSVITGKPVARENDDAEEERENFLMGMFNLARISAPVIAEKITLDANSRLLDIGGGPGTYAIYFCLANSGLQATVFDRPTSEPFARKTVDQYNLSDRIDFLGGDFNKDPFPGKTFDVAWLSHILHSNGPLACRQLIQKVADCLLPNGRILIHDFFLDAEKDGPEFPALFALNMLVGTQDGRTYSQIEVREMLKEAGFNRIEPIDFQSPNNSTILSATL